ncbi:hypothetical protein [Tumebacillus algifaecis]|nr:hypothetical protein [Tumebacillus algifaecis]
MVENQRSQATESEQTKVDVKRLEEGEWSLEELDRRIPSLSQEQTADE